MQARLQKGPDGYKKGGAPAHPVFLKAPPRQAEREWRSPNPTGGKGNSGVQIPPKAKGMAEPKSRISRVPQLAYASQLCSCKSPWALTPAKQHSSKGYRPRQNNFVAPCAHIHSTTTYNNVYCPRRIAGTRQYTICINYTIYVTCIVSGKYKFLCKIYLQF